MIREREHGTLEHLLVMPLTPFGIMTAKVWANGLVVLAGIALSLQFVVLRALGIPIAGSIPLFMFWHRRSSTAAPGSTWSWPQFVAIIGVGVVFFVGALLRLRASLAAQS